MNLLLDSHALLWALHAPGEMRPEAVRAIRAPDRVVYFSAASAWELELKAAKGKLTLPDRWLRAAHDTGLLELKVTSAEAQASARLPWHHADPFDRVLVAQAQAYQLTIATRDPRIAPYGVAVMPV